MSNVNELRQYVRKHPDDRSQRWRLAKKLYMSGDFEDALTHLRVLRRQWPSKINVARYLAATHYRMGDNSRAIQELEKALDTWPDEIPIRQQLAHILESEGLKAAAYRAWQEVLTRQPQHPYARDAMNALSGKPSAPPEKKPGESASLPEAGRRCPNCGAENGDEFERCWQCHSVLAIDAEPERKAKRPPLPGRAPLHRIDLQDHTSVTLASVVVAIVAIFVSVYCFYNAAMIDAASPANKPPSATVYTTLGIALFDLRMGMAVILVVFCPIALYAAAFATRTPLPSAGTIAAVGIAQAALAIVLTWLPMTVLVAAPFVFVMGVFALTMWLFSPRFVQGAVIAGIQCAVSIGLSAGAAYQAEGDSFLTELPAIVQYGAEHDRKASPGKHVLAPMDVPAGYTFQFSTTGSPWLDDAGATVRVSIGSDQPTEAADIELFEYQESLEYVYTDPAVLAFQAKLGRPYRVVLGGKSYAAKAEGTLYTILPVLIETDAAPAEPSEAPPA